VGIFNIVNAVAVVIVVEVILYAIVVKVTGPLELINSCIVIVVFIVPTRS
jgi:hypothetical protein